MRQQSVCAKPRNIISAEKTHTPRKKMGSHHITFGQPPTQAKEVESPKGKSRSYGAGEPIHVEVPLPASMPELKNEEQTSVWKFPAISLISLTFPHTSDKCKLESAVSFHQFLFVYIQLWKTAMSATTQRCTNVPISGHFPNLLKNIKPVSSPDDFTRMVQGTRANTC